jgi:hypothetical protein
VSGDAKLTDDTVHVSAASPPSVDDAIAAKKAKLSNATGEKENGTAENNAAS